MNESLSIFFLGIVAGHAFTLLWFVYLAMKSPKKTSATSNKPTVNERMKRIKEITNEQLDLTRQVDGPQKNGLDGRHKNGMIGKIKRLDEEKNELLKSILLDGYDPELSTVDNAGVVTHMKLSEYMVLMGIKMEPKKSSSPSIEKAGRFTIVKGGKDDGGETTH